MFYAAWIVLTAAGILAGLVVFLWAIKTGQFSDQGRARYLPLSDGHAPMAEEPASGFKVEAVALILVVVLVLGAMVSAVFLVLSKVNG